MSDEERKDQSKSQREDEGVSLKSQTVDLLVANVIPTTKYFESRFDFLQHQIHELREGQKRLEEAMNQRFEQVDKRFEQVNGEIRDFKSSVDKRFEQVNGEIRDFKSSVDKRFEQVDKRFEQMIASIDRLSDKLDRRDLDQRNFTIRMFTIAISISFLGVLGALLKIVGVF